MTDMSRNPPENKENFQDSMKATTEVTRDGKTNVILYWKPSEGVLGYNLYRRSISEDKMPDTPINGSTCIRAVPRSARERWQLLEDAFQTQMWQKTKVKTKASALEKPTFPESAAAGLSEKEEVIFSALALVDFEMRLAMGLGFVDSNVKKDEEYVYELRGVIRADNSEIPLSKEVKVQAGHFLLPNPPSSIRTISGDHKVLILWDRNNDPETPAYSYVVKRAGIRPTGKYQIINDRQILFDITEDLDNRPLLESSRESELPADKLRKSPYGPPTPGFLDYQRWSDTGFPENHFVNGEWIEGPENGITYYYMVASVDILGRVGDWSGAYPATPVDKTPPMSPRDFRVDPYVDPKQPNLSKLVLSWRKVTEDAEGHRDEESRTYKIYRSRQYKDLEKIDSSTTFFTQVQSPPEDPPDMRLVWIDNDPLGDGGQGTWYGDQTVWYRVCCEDPHGNLSAPSALIQGKVLDIWPPGPTNIKDSVGKQKYIRITWWKNQEPDVAGYQIYRTICDKGLPYQEEEPSQEGPRALKSTTTSKKKGCDFALIGEVLAEDNPQDEGKGVFYAYEDKSLPEESPLCYAYWVRAFDKNRNLHQGTPDGCPNNPQEYICERLAEEKPPDVPVISGLKAKNNSVLVKWIASPIQDLYAFHIYRSEKEHECVRERDWVGCVFKKDGKTSESPWKGFDHVNCAEISAVPDPTTASREFLDTGVKPNKVYWYRVSALDWLGNESEGDDLTKIPAVSTFTYSKDKPETPTVLPCKASLTEGCGLIVRWEPKYDADKVEGFVVFRSTAIAGNYRQVSPIIEGNEFSDKSAIKSTKYWYRVQAVGERGKLSEPSQPVPYEY
jgi:hypothetical protein